MTRSPAPSDTPRTDAVTRTSRFLDPDKDFVKLAATYSDLLQLARQLERELAEARRDFVRASIEHSSDLTLRSAERCDRDAIIEECAKLVSDFPFRVDDTHSYRWSDTYKTAAWEMSHAIRALKNAAPHSVSAPTGELDVAPARGRNTAGGESSSGHAVAAPYEDAERYRWLRECEPERRIEIMERAETPDLLDHHIDKGRAGW